MVMDANTPIPSGGASSLDMSNERDRGAIRQAAKNWPRRFAGITPERKDRWLKDLDLCRDKTLGTIIDADPVEGVKAITSIVKTELAMELANQKDEHAVMGLNRNETTVNVAVGVGVDLPRDRELRAQLIEVHARLEEAEARSKMQQATEGPRTNGNGHA